ncbi:ATP-dependent (S)-NAD(P)H-hydrate dehydratase [Nilaparvata lugens]|uniref:ATP-dependent (S)-NAD(P)H-hydrate dehydratase n=1 Tax=Nilaparvata lugens TaxID=108931 RepID=UPI00193C9A0F|nr:ATP-dependent (S)-NAD(P)H-hydrate dehydratase [Nilaparvata lugens]
MIVHLQVIKLLKVGYPLIRKMSRSIPEQLNKGVVDKDLIKAARSLLPILGFENHKGSCGRIGVFGGSIEFTGAPYYAGYSALRTGVDLVYIFCATAAAQAIKSYSPELMVLPYLDDQNAIDKITPWLNRLHALLIGPGLGRHEYVSKTLVQVINHLECNNLAIPLIFDADGLFFLSQHPQLMQNYEGNIYITPNVVEFKFLARSILNVTEEDTEEHLLTALPKGLGNNVTINLKGFIDLMANNGQIVKCSVEGSPRRCGGQGDMLSGILTAFAAWVKIRGNSILPNTNIPAELIASYAASSIVRSCNKLAFMDNGRGMIVTDMIDKIIPVTNELLNENKTKN